MEQGHEVSGHGFFHGIEAECVRERRIAGDDLAVRPNDQIGGEIFRDETPVAFFALAQRLLGLFPRGDVRVDLQPLQAVVGGRPATYHQNGRAVSASLVELAFPMRIIPQDCFQLLGGAGGFRAKQRVDILAERILLLPAVHACRAAIPICDDAGSVRENDRVVRELEELFRGIHGVVRHHGADEETGVGVACGPL